MGLSLKKNDNILTKIHNKVHVLIPIKPLEMRPSSSVVTIIRFLHVVGAAAWMDHITAGCFTIQDTP